GGSPDVGTVRGGRWNFAGGPDAQLHPDGRGPERDSAGDGAPAGVPLRGTAGVHLAGARGGGAEYTPSRPLPGGGGRHLGHVSAGAGLGGDRGAAERRSGAGGGGAVGPRWGADSAAGARAAVADGPRRG